MNRLLLSASLLAALFSSTAALAQPDHKDEARGAAHGHQPAAGAANRGGHADQGGHGGQGGQERGGHAQAQAAAAQAGARGDHQGRAERAPPQRAALQPRAVEPNRGAAFQHEQLGAERGRQARSAPAIEQRSHSNREAAQAGFAQRGAVNPGPRPSGRFVYRGRPHEAIRGPGYSYPSGWSYRRWSYGQSLPMLFLSQSYFFNDYDRYGFGPPPRHYMWVRYGPDLLLVNRRTGRIREVIYGVFY